MVQHLDGVTDLYIHEIAIHHSHNIDDFRPPYAVMEEDPDAPDYITAAHIESLTICLHSIHRIFNAFLAMTVANLRALPTIFFVRNSYAAVALIKMYTAITAKGSTFGSVFKPEDLKVDYYLDAVVEQLRKAGEGGQCRVASKFIHVFAMLANWQVKRAAGTLEDCEKSASMIWNPSPQPDAKVPQKPSQARKTGQNGLQVLSEAAMVNNSSNNADPSSSSAVSAAAIAAASTSSLPTPSALQGAWDSSTTATSTNAPSYMAEPSGFLPDMEGGIDNFVLSAEDLEAIGYMVDNPGWIEWSLGLSGAPGVLL